MGAVESIAEENSVIRFVDSVEISHEEDTSILTQEHGLNEHVSENKGEFESLIDLCSVGRSHVLYIVLFSWFLGDQLFHSFMALKLDEKTFFIHSLGQDEYLFW